MKLTKKQKEFYLLVLDNDSKYYKEKQAWIDSGYQTSLYPDKSNRGIEIFTGRVQWRVVNKLIELDLIEVWSNESGHPYAYVKGYMESEINED